MITKICGDGFSFIIIFGYLERYAVNFLALTKFS